MPSRRMPGLTARMTVFLAFDSFMFSRPLMPSLDPAMPSWTRWRTMASIESILEVGSLTTALPTSPSFVEGTSSSSSSALTSSSSSSSELRSSSSSSSSSPLTAASADAGLFSSSSASVLGSSGSHSSPSVAEVFMSRSASRVSMMSNRISMSLSCWAITPIAASLSFGSPSSSRRSRRSLTA